MPAAGDSVAGWFSTWTWLTALLAYALFVPLLFPDGRLPGRRWRVVAWADGVALLGVFVAAAVDVEVLGVIFVVGSIALVPVSLASVVVRYRRRARPSGFSSAGAYSPCAPRSPASSVVSLLASVVEWVQFLYVFVYALLPMAVGVAMLRYRLYEIDVIIRRTLTYACLVAALAIVYLGGVAAVGRPARPHGLLERARRDLVDAGRRACVQPLRRRIQRAVDHRFSRAMYDADQGAVEAFSGRLREQIDLDALSAELIAVVRRTVQPSQTSLWLRPSDGDRPVGDV